MWVYWGLFLWPAFAAAGPTRSNAQVSKLAIRILAVVLVLVIGLRFEVGMDWGNYLGFIDTAHTMTWRETVASPDSLYWLLNWLADRSGLGVWLVNFCCALAFVSGFVAFAMRRSNPWLALAVGMPYMAIVMAMNYTRQGAAVGFVLWALIALEDGQVRQFVILVGIAALFHRSAALLMPLGALASARNWSWAFLWISIASALAYVFLLAGTQETLIETYMNQRMISDGANVRVAMNSVAALLYLILRKRLALGVAGTRFWTRYSIVTLLFIPALIFSPSSTAVDRVALYFMPIQLVVFSQLPRIAERRSLEIATVCLVASAYAIILFVWFNFSPFAFAWLPYRFYPFEVLQGG